MNRVVVTGLGCITPIGNSVSDFRTSLFNGTTGIALVNMGSVPLRATAVEDALAGGASGTEAASHAADGLDPPADLNASPEFRRHLATVLTRRALEEVAAGHP